MGLCQGVVRVCVLSLLSANGCDSRLVKEETERIESGPE